MATEEVRMDSPLVQASGGIYCEDEREKKLVYLFFLNWNTGRLFKVVTFDPHQEEQVVAAEDPSNKRFVDVTSMFLEKIPAQLCEIRYSCIQVLGSKVYFIGGSNPEDAIERQSNKVFAFDTSSKTWAPLASTKIGRLGSPTVTYQGRIYVFGCYYWWTLPTHHNWVEVYDPESNQWNDLGDVAPEALRTRTSGGTIAVVSEHLKTIFLCARYSEVYGYSLDEKCWLGCISQPAFTGYGLCWNETLAVVNNTLFWECWGTIQAIDCDRLAEPPVVKYTTPFSPETMMRFGKQSKEEVGLRQPTFLLNAGNGKMVLCYGCWDKSILCCHTFEVTRSTTEKQFHLHKKDDQEYDRGLQCFLFSANVMNFTEKSFYHLTRTW